MSLFPGPESDTVIQGRIWARPQRLNPVPSQVTSHESEPQAESLALESHGTPRGDSAWLDAELRLRASGFPAAAAGKLEKSPAAAGKSHRQPRSKVTSTGSRGQKSQGAAGPRAKGPGPARARRKRRRKMITSPGHVPSVWPRDAVPVTRLASHVAGRPMSGRPERADARLRHERPSRALVVRNSAENHLAPAAAAVPPRRAGGCAS